MIVTDIVKEHFEESKESDEIILRRILMLPILIRIMTLSYPAIDERKIGF